MNKDKYESLNLLYCELMAFNAQAYAPRYIDDVKGGWIISQDESKALEILLEMLADCVAHSEVKEQEIK